MADGYAQATRNAAFVNLHSAVGVGHALGSIFTAMRNQTPLVITAGQQSRELLTGRAVPLLRAGDRAAEAVREVERRAGSGRRRARRDRPRVLHRDAARRRGRRSSRSPRTTGMPMRRTSHVAARCGATSSASPRRSAAVAAALNDSARPALVVGAGVDRDGACDARRRARRAHRSDGVGEPACRAGAAFPRTIRRSRASSRRRERRLAEQLAPHDVVVVLGAPVFTYHVRSEGDVDR